MPELHLSVERLDDVAEELRPLYQQGDDGKFHLPVLGIDGLKSALKKERENRENLAKDLKRFEGVDPEKYQELLAKIQEFDDKKLKDDGKIDELVNKRTERMRDEYENRLKQSSDKIATQGQELEALRGSLNKAVIERGILDAITKVGMIRPEALPDILSRALAEWKIDDQGYPVAVNPDGSQKYGADGLKALTMDEWAAEKLRTAPHWFGDSKGGGAENKGDKKMLPGDFQNLPPVERLKRHRQAGRT